MKLVVAEKPTVGAALAAVLCATERKDGCLCGNGWIMSWCVGHLVELAAADAYDERFAKWRLEDLPVLPDEWRFVSCGEKKKQLDILRRLMNDKSVDSVVCATDAGNLPKPKGSSMFHLVLPTVVKVMYCCGLRVSEALALKVKDVDFEEGFIFIRRSKFENSRRLPVSASLLHNLRKYRDANSGLIGVDKEAFFLPNADGEQYSQRTVYDKFRTVLWSSGIPHQGCGKGPRVHDLRHTFAVRALRQSIMAGKDLYVFLPVLMSYLGHRKLSSTEYYLRLTQKR